MSYACGSCGTQNPDLWKSCQRQDCPDGRDRPVDRPGHEFDPFRADLPRSPLTLPRWQQGPRPWLTGDVWDEATPHQRRRMFIAKIIAAVVDLGAIWLVWTYF